MGKEVPQISTEIKNLLVNVEHLSPKISGQKLKYTEN